MLKAPRILRGAFCREYTNADKGSDTFGVFCCAEKMLKTV